MSLRAAILGLAALGAGVLGTAALAASADEGRDFVLDQLQAELDRAWTALGRHDEPPYFIQAAVTDQRGWEVQGSFGGTGAPSATRRRLGDIDLRVGSPELDNTHKIRDAGWFDDQPRPRLDLPIVDTHPHAWRLALWRALDDSYRAAVRRLIKVRTNDAVKVAREDPSPDFSPVEPVVDLRPVRPLAPDLDRWRAEVARASAVFDAFPEVFDANISFEAHDDTHYLVTTEGTRLRFQRVRYRVSAYARTTAEDGMALEVYDYVDTDDRGELPEGAALDALARRVAQQVTDLRHAPLVEPWAGPAILRGRAAAVFFHEILGHRVEGHRQKDEDEGQTLTDKVGRPIFPDFIDVVDDPTLEEYAGVRLAGTYPYDDEGVPAQRVVVVEGGVLRNFLMSRSPIRGFDHSNGHGRRQPGSAPLPRQGNLIVTARETVPYARLREMLLEQVRAEGKEFGLVFDDISGGFTFTGRSTPNSYSVQPVTVWKVYADGRPDELVRGVDLIGTPLTTFSRIVAASDQVQVFNGVCGAESGWVPVSAAAPDLLVSEMEVQRREKANDRPPILPPPGVAEGGAK